MWFITAVWNFSFKRICCHRRTKLWRLMSHVANSYPSSVDNAITVFVIIVLDERSIENVSSGDQLKNRVDFWISLMHYLPQRQRLVRREDFLPSHLSCDVCSRWLLKQQWTMPTWIKSFERTGPAGGWGNRSSLSLGHRSEQITSTKSRKKCHALLWIDPLIDY